jgi:hypothetical protein
MATTEVLVDMTDVEVLVADMICGYVYEIGALITI